MKSYFRREYKVSKLNNLCASTIKKDIVSLERHALNIMKMKYLEMKGVSPMHAGKDIQEAVDILEKMEFVSLVKDVHMCIVRLSKRPRLMYSIKK